MSSVLSDLKNNKIITELPQYKINKLKPIKLATVFSGIGAIEHALKRLNLPYKLMFACDIDKFVKESYFANYDIEEKNWYEDITNIKGKKFKGKIDLLVGGSPCQSFSTVGKMKGLKDMRGSLIYEFIRLIKEIEPKIFIFENVKGLLGHNQGKTWDIIKTSFEKTGYKMHFKILNAKDFGIPQNRERLFVVGIKTKTKKFDFPNLMELSFFVPDFLIDKADKKYYLTKKGIEFVTSVKQQKMCSTQINGKVALCQRANQQFNWHGDFIWEKGSPVEKKYFLSQAVKQYVLSTGTKNFYSKPKTNLQIARPLLATMASMHRAGVDNYFTYGAKIRKLTPRECMRLMGFDDTYKIVVSDTQAYKQAGNSIVVNVLMHILKKLYL